MSESKTPAAEIGLRAKFSPCGKYRFQLWDDWDSTRPILPWILFNPSVAGQAGESGAVRSDPTARKGRGFAERHGFGGMVFVNLFAWIATHPKELRAAGYPVGPCNDQYILDACAMGDGRVICAWGALARGLERPQQVLEMIRRAGFAPMAFGFTGDGLPRHPLMLPYSTLLESFPVSANQVIRPLAGA